MIIPHFHLQPQSKYEFFHIYFTSVNTSVMKCMRADAILGYTTYDIKIKCSICMLVYSSYRREENYVRNRVLSCPVLSSMRESPSACRKCPVILVLRGCAPFGQHQESTSGQVQRDSCSEWLCKHNR